MALVLVLGAWEWCRLIGLTELKLQAVYIVGMLLTALIVQFLPSIIIYALASLWWFFALVLVLQFPGSQGLWENHMPIKIAIGFALLVPTWLGIVELQGQNVWNLVLVFILIWSADSGAYFAGRKFGNKKLAPEVSPGKSIEGVIGGLLLALAVALVFQNWTDLKGLGFLQSLILFVAVVLFSVLGDLTESMFKRASGVKDSSQLLPGHGGILDRIDSLTSAVPIYFTFYWLLS